MVCKIDRQIGRQIDRWMDRQMDGWIDGSMDRWMDGQMRQIDRIRGAVEKVMESYKLGLINLEDCASICVPTSGLDRVTVL